MILVFLMLSFEPAFLLFSFSFIKRLFSSSSLSAIMVVSSAYLRLLIFLPAILIPACASCSLPARALGIYRETSGDVNVELARKKHSENWLLANEIADHFESPASW